MNKAPDVEDTTEIKEAEPLPGAGKYLVTSKGPNRKERRTRSAIIRKGLSKIRARFRRDAIRRGEWKAIAAVPKTFSEAEIKIGDQVIPVKDITYQVGEAQ